MFDYAPLCTLIYTPSNDTLSEAEERIPSKPEKGHGFHVFFCCAKPVVPASARVSMNSERGHWSNAALTASRCIRRAVLPSLMELVCTCNQPGTEANLGRAVPKPTEGLIMYVQKAGRGSNGGEPICWASVTRLVGYPT